MTDETSARLALPLLKTGQAQKELSHNEALALLDIAVQAGVEAVEVNLPPVDPSPGASWIVGPAPTGVWAGRAGALAGWTPGGWRFVSPSEGMRVWDAGSGAFAVFTAGAWTIGQLRGRVFVDGVQVVGPRAAAIADPTGGETIDTEARAALAGLLAALRDHGLLETG